MKRIFVTLAVVTSLLLLTTIIMGLNIGDANNLDKQTQSKISTHMLVGMATLAFAIFAHAVSLTYFMGTGRWIEETSEAYSLGDSFYERSKKIKYGTLPGLTVCIGLLIATGAFGAVADPATPMNIDGFLGMTGAQVHLLIAVFTGIANVLVNFTQTLAISRNTSVVEAVLAEVHKIRTERGLPT